MPDTKQQHWNHLSIRLLIHGNEIYVPSFIAGNSNGDGSFHFNRGYMYWQQRSMSEDYTKGIKQLMDIHIFNRHLIETRIYTINSKTYTKTMYCVGVYNTTDLWTMGDRIYSNSIVGCKESKV